VPLQKFIYQHVLHNFSLLPPKAVCFSSAVSKNACDTVWQLLVFFARIFGPGTGNKIITILLRQKILSYFLGLFLTFHPSTLLPFFGCGRRPRCV